MIFQQIKAHQEPQPTYHTSVNYYPGRTAEQQKEWDVKCHHDLSVAIATYEIGDLVSLTANKNTRMKIVSFVEDPTKAIEYQKHPCIIMARNPQWTQSNPTGYSLPELDATSITKVIEEASNDE